MGGAVGGAVAGAVGSAVAGAVGSAAAGAAGLAGRTAVRVARLPAPAVARATSAATSLGRQAFARAEQLGREAAPASRALLDLHAQRSRRRVWSDGGRAHLEVRGLTGSGTRHRRLAASVRQRLGGLRGVRWAEVNAVTGQVLVAFDERRVDVGRLLEVVRDVEEAHGTREENFSWSHPVHPSDSTPIAAAAVELAADCLAVGAGVVGQLTRLPALPREVLVARALLEVERPLRRGLKRRIGPIGTDVVLALSAAALQGLSQGPGMPAVDALYRLELLGEALSRRAVWRRRESELCCTADTLPREAPEHLRDRCRGPVDPSRSGATSSARARWPPPAPCSR